MKKNTIAIDFESNEARVTKAFAKAASIFGTPEYEEWKACREQNPGIRLVTKTIKKKSDKRTYRNMTYKNMERYITINSPELVAEFKQQITQSRIQEAPYRAVLAWFLTQFNDYDSYKTFFDSNDDNQIDSGNTRPDNISTLAMASNQ